MLVIFRVITLAATVATVRVIVAAIVGVATHPTATSNEKMMWILIVLFLTVIGAIIWFSVGRKNVGQTAQMTIRRLSLPGTTRVVHRRAA